MNPFNQNPYVILGLSPGATEKQIKRAYRRCRFHHIDPRFISYPIIASTLIGEGASYGVVATFMTTLMMVGVITFPLEAKYFGRKVALLRNALHFVTAVLIGVLAGLIL